ncbi:MAG: asparagine synthase (glutamine-hydrolyzing) [Methanomicrobiales archaeon]|nr:asparagine synthase (glutamine-hydrolyzing) [Methanomicrobiales archaeon]
MCGIAGIFEFSTAPVDAALLSEMSARLAHRGPDGSATRIDGPVGLAHRRLSIIDLSAAGAQPMPNEDQTKWLIFNGEIYNYIELREELVCKGHVFRSSTDGEVILHAYEEWGTRCLARFNGMWAFALWDASTGQLFCARDRFGIKPFYYTQAGEAFLFASEIKALLAHPDVGGRPNERMLFAFLAFGVMDHTGETMFDGVRQIPPAHYMLIGKDGPGTPERYWDFRINPLPRAADTTGAPGELRSLLADAVSIELRSDVPVGTCLSGGIDSSTLVMLINRIIASDSPRSIGERQNTFSSCYADPRFDECRFVDLLVSGTGINTHRTSPAAQGFLENLEHLIRSQDEPFPGLSIYAQYCVMRLARERVKVVLDGQGADELLAGYIAYQAPYIRGLVSRGKVLTALRETVGSLHTHGRFFREAFSQQRIRSQRRGLLRLGGIPIDRYAGTLDRVLKAEITATNLPALLHFEDRNSMAFSIEARVPYLDHRVAEYLAALPLGEKIRNGITKYVLRRAIKGIVPEEIRCRMDKMGFVAPEEVWMKDDLRVFVNGVITAHSFMTRPYWDAIKVRDDYQAFVEGKTPYSSELWRIVCTELWLRMFFDTRRDTRTPVS